MDNQHRLLACALRLHGLQLLLDYYLTIKARKQDLVLLAYGLRVR